MYSEITNGYQYRVAILYINLNIMFSIILRFVVHAELSNFVATNRVTVMKILINLIRIDDVM